jgi:hypothetical protein
MKRGGRMVFVRAGKKKKEKMLIVLMRLMRLIQNIQKYLHHTEMDIMMGF